MNYESANTLPGGYVLKLGLVVDVVHNQAGGVSEITQAISPPMDIKMPVHGTVTDMTVMPKNTHHLVNLTSAPTVGRYEQIRLVTSDDWQTGTANVTLFTDTPQGVIHFTTDVKVVKAPQK
ncbi:MAG: DUF1842 domain-containing protein [Magnetospirillum sp.]|nr:DUF1842 domain-containing protein [Magnetospirillum sp.]